MLRGCSVGPRCGKHAVGHLVGDWTPVVDGLLELCSDSRLNVRWGAVYAIGHAGAVLCTSTARHRLLTILDNQDEPEDIRLLALRALLPHFDHIFGHSQHDRSDSSNYQDQDMQNSKFGMLWSQENCLRVEAVLTRLQFVDAEVTSQLKKRSGCSHELLQLTL